MTLVEHWQELLVGLVAFALIVLHQWWLHAGACRKCRYRRNFEHNRRRDRW